MTELISTWLPTSVFNQSVTVRTESTSNSQMDSAFGSGSEPCQYSNLAVLCISQTVLYHCRRISIEELGLFHPYLRVTRRLATYIHQLCKVMTVTEVSRHLHLDWKTVKEIDKQYLEVQYGQIKYDGLRILAVDEISIIQSDIIICAYQHCLSFRA
ncbi:MAG: transposase family protein [bacterium]|nr:MAG: transposase family protein [bacterium]